MKIVFGEDEFVVEEAAVAEFTALDPNEDHSFPEQLRADFKVLIQLLELPNPEARLLQKTSDLESFVRFRRLALEQCGLKKLEPSFQAVFARLLQRDTAKLTAKAMGFATRDFATREEEQFVDRCVRRLMRKIDPPRPIELNKVE